MRLVVTFGSPGELIAQEAHLARGCLYVPEPAPPPEPFAEVDVVVQSPNGAAPIGRGKVVQIVGGRAIAIALDDVAGARAALAPLIARARPEGGAGGAEPVAGEPASSTKWAIPGPAPSAGGGAAPPPPHMTTAPEETDAEASAGDEPPPVDPEGDGDVPPELHQRIKEMSTTEKMKLAAHGDRTARVLLMRDTNKTIQTFVLQNKRITLDEVRWLAAYRQAHPEVLVTIAGNRDWTMNPGVVNALVRNPKTPGPTAVKLLEKLPIAEVRRLAKSNDVPRAVQMAARKKAVDA